MTNRQQGITASLILHGGVLFLLYALSSGFAQTSRPIAIDFSLLEPAGPPGPAAPAGPPTPPTPKQATPKLATPAPQRVLTRLKPLPASLDTPRQAPATEIHGAAPILAEARTALPETSAQVSAVAGSGSTTGGQGSGAGGSGTGSGSGSGSSAEQLRNRYRAEQFAYIKRIIERNLTYPPRAQRMGLTGTCIVTFVVQETGQVTNIAVTRSAGHHILDDNVIEAIRRSAPFPRPPVAAELKIPISYRIE